MYNSTASSLDLSSAWDSANPPSDGGKPAQNSSVEVEYRAGLGELLAYLYLHGRLWSLALGVHVQISGFLAKYLPLALGVPVWFCTEKTAQTGNIASVLIFSDQTSSCLAYSLASASSLCSVQMSPHFCMQDITSTLSWQDVSVSGPWVRTVLASHR